MLLFLFFGVFVCTICSAFVVLSKPKDNFSRMTVHISKRQQVNMRTHPFVSIYLRCSRVFLTAYYSYIKGFYAFVHQNFFDAFDYCLLFNFNFNFFFVCYSQAKADLLFLIFIFFLFLSLFCVSLVEQYTSSKTREEALLPFYLSFFSFRLLLQKILLAS